MAKGPKKNQNVAIVVPSGNGRDEGATKPIADNKDHPETTNVPREQASSSSLPPPQQQQQQQTEEIEVIASDDDEIQDPDTAGESSSQQQQQQQQSQERRPNNKLFKSSRLKSYITLCFSSFINYDSAVKSYSNVQAAGVPSTKDERNYAVAVSLISLTLAGLAVLMHLDRFTPLQRVWMRAFQPKSKIELALACFLVFWWSIATGIETSITGVAGDAKGQYSFYFSAWLCTSTSLGILDLWVVATNSSGARAFIASWPNRAPAWLCIFFLSFLTLIWYLDLWQNYDKLDREDEQFILEYFQGISDGQWHWIMILTVYTVVAAAVFVLVELFRETKQDGSSPEKGSGEKILEGLCFASLVLAWVPTVMIATTPGGAAALNGNAYFFTWILVVFIFEGTVWYIHDMRKDLHRALKQKEEEYRLRQKQVLENTKCIQQRANQDAASNDDGHVVSPMRERIGTEYFDAADTL